MGEFRQAPEGVGVPVAVGVDVAVGVGVPPGVTVGVAAGVPVGVIVGVGDGVGVPLRQVLVNSTSSTHQPAPGISTPLSRPSLQRTRTPLPAKAPRFTSTRSILGVDGEVPVQAARPAIGL